MRHTHKNSLALVTSVGLLAASFCGLVAPPLSAQTRTVTLESGTVLPVVLDTELSSNKSQRGDRFTAHLRTTDRTYLGIPTGTILEGVITEAQPKEDKDPGILDMRFDKMRLPNGKVYAIKGDLIGLDNKSVDKRSDGRLVAKPGRKRDDLKFIGYGAGAGALIGILAGGKLRLENILLGAAAGYGISALTQGKAQPRDVTLKSGSAMGVRLDKNVRLAGLNAEERYENEEELTPTETTRPGDNDQETLEGTGNSANRYDFAVMVGDQNVFFNGKAKPFQSGDTWMLPVKPVLEAAQVRFRFIGSTKELEVTNTSTKLKVGIGSRVVILDDGSRRRLDKEVRIINGTTYAPVRFFEMATLRKATFDRSSNTLMFNDRGAE